MTDWNIPENWTEESPRGMAVDLLSKVPPGWWVTYGEISDALIALGHPMTPRAVSAMFDAAKRDIRAANPDRPLDPGTDPEDWLIKWWRLRNPNGRFVAGTEDESHSRTIGSEEIADPDWFINKLFTAEDGELDATGAASIRRRYDLARAVAAPADVRPNPICQVCFNKHDPTEDCF